MSHSALISDSSSSFSLRLAESLRSRGGEAFLTASAAHVHESPAPGTILWNRLSLLSARTVSVSMKNRCESVDSVVFVYDGPETEASCAHVSLEESAAFLEEWNRGLFLLSAVMEEHLRAQNRGKLVFVQRAGPSPSKAKAAAMLEAAFCRLAEETAEAFGASAKGGLQTLLVRLEGENPAEDAEWLAERLVSAAPERGGARWIKSGSRPLFGKF